VSAQFTIEARELPRLCIQKPPKMDKLERSIHFRLP
jgi:hypothetical protein